MELFMKLYLSILKIFQVKTEWLDDLASLKTLFAHAPYPNLARQLCITELSAYWTSCSLQISAVVTLWLSRPLIKKTKLLNDRL